MAAITEGVNVSVDGHTVTVKGPNGEVKRSFSKRTEIKVEGNEVKVISKDSGLVGTVDSVISSMIKGVSEGYSKKLKMLYAHFPISLEVKGNEILVKNFLGEKQPRKTAIVGNSKIEVKGQDVTVSGPDKEAVGQTVANLKRAMKIKEKDPRIFQDGIYDAGE